MHRTCSRVDSDVRTCMVMVELGSKTGLVMEALSGSALELALDVAFGKVKRRSVLELRICLWGLLWGRYQMLNPGGKFDVLE